MKLNDIDFIWCVKCIRKKPKVWNKSVRLIPLRESPYDLAPDGLNIDKRLVGVCGDCLENAVNDFQYKNSEPVDVNNVHMIKYHK